MLHKYGYKIKMKVVSDMQIDVFAGDIDEDKKKKEKKKKDKK